MHVPKEGGCMVGETVSTGQGYAAVLKTISAVWFPKVKSIGSKKVQKMLPVYLG